MPDKMYKIIQDSKVVDVVKNPDFLRFLRAGHVTITDKSSAHGIGGSDRRTVYSFGIVDRPNTPVVTIEAISPKEFNRLNSLLNSGEEIRVGESRLERVKRDKLNQLSNSCKTAIVNGFTVKLNDGNSYAFKLTNEDQLNLLSLENQFNAGEDFFVYHATNCPCQLFNRDDMSTILKAFRKHTLYHTTYFNAAKQYINAQTYIEAITAFSYGTDITNTVKSGVLKSILEGGGILE